ncbi:MAG TPA: hypothetical protein VFS61_10230 [Anaerolineales bacterium]|nr:hypothetical protein [Anaerolineales bacterium]
MRNTIIHIRQGFASSSSAIASGILVCAGIAVYALWYASAGYFSPLIPIDNAYVALGESFLQGQLSLLAKPDPEFMALQDPYDPAKRVGTFLWDASYYEGKYYLYWGPVPALAFAAIEGVTKIRPPGALLVVLCYMGLPIILTILLYQLRKSFFPHAPGFFIGLCTLMGFINLPFLFLLARPAVYETSIIAGQFFLLLGLLGWVMYLTRTDAAGWLIMAGLSWGLAMGSRHNLVISIGVYLAFALIQIVRDGNEREMQRPMLLLLAPLALCMIGLAVYNFARFGNPFEIGVNYQLSLPADPDGYFSTAYILSNLFVYLFYPMTTSGSFPFILSTLPAGSQFDEVVAGLVFSTPGVWLVTLAIPSFFLARKPMNTLQDAPVRRSIKTLFFMVVSAGFVQFLFLTMFFFAAMRYMADFYLPLVLGIWLLVWWVDERIRHSLRLRLALWLAVTLLVFWTVGIGFFGSFDIPPQSLRVLNPDLYMQIASYWNHWFHSLEIFRAY